MLVTDLRILRRLPVMRALVVSGHPHLEGSNANAAILDELRAVLPGTTIHRLDTAPTSPEGRTRFNVPAEQALLDEADAVVLATPLYWYSWSGLMKQWVEEVWADGWAFRSGSAAGCALDGKPAVLSLTVGETQAFYTPAGSEPHSVEEYLCPVYRTLEGVGLRLLDTVISYGASLLPPAGTAERTAYDRALRDSARRIATLVTGVAS
ncbi:NAD(P)H-dependent oxidoreductase [Actinomyces slackii]|uniref:General stress protein 14 n=2 Tax=Actinomyces slackii TaxID=52774 RepID=A0A448KG50_9ACTO|nr:General stress protein 14 [Actinomyces slackii]